jgi:hypothetical protein
MGRYLDIAKTAGKRVPESPNVAPVPASSLSRPPTVVAMGAQPERLAEVRAAYRGAMARLALRCPLGLHAARAEIEALPGLASRIDAAEQAADMEALAYQRGIVGASDGFLAALGRWENAWADALAVTAQAQNACDDCGRADATVMVTTATGRYCRRCLREGERVIVSGGEP